MTHGERSWEMVSLKQIVSPRTLKVNPQEHTGLPYIGLEDVESKTRKILSYQDSSTLRSVSSRIFSGDLIYSRLRPYLNKVAIADRESLCSAEFIVLPPTPNTDTRFLLYILNSQQFVRFANSLNTGDRPRVNFKQIGDFTLLLPPLDEQQKIVEAIETQFAHLDAAVAALERAKTRLKRYRASVLKAACEGRLLNTRTPSLFPIEPLGNHFARIEAGKNLKCEERPPESTEYGIVKISAVTWGRFDETASKTCALSDSFQERYAIQRGDFLFSRANTIELVGACVIVDRIDRRLMISDKVLRLSFSERLLPHWAMYYLRSQQGRNEIEQRATGNQLSMRNIGQDRIRAIPIPVPPIAEQARIVAEVERRMSVIEQLESLIEANMNRAGTLRQSILQLAFSGRLTTTTSRPNQERIDDAITSITALAERSAQLGQHA